MSQWITIQTPEWFFDSATPAWVQAFATFVALLIAIAVPALQRHAQLRDAEIDRQRRKKEYLRRLTAGLRAEIIAALSAGQRQQETIERTFAQVQEAVRNGAKIKETGPVNSGSMALTDGIIYREIASEIGRFPTEVVRQVVQFYSITFDASWRAEAAPTAIEAYDFMRSVAPRFRMHAAVLIRILDKFEASDYAVDANLKLDAAEMGASRPRRVSP